MKNISFIFTLFLITTAFAQEHSTISIFGFVKNDFIYDSRQVFAARDGHFLFHPLPQKKDVNGEDINAQSVFNILSIQSRLGVKFSGPESFGAKTMGVIETDFFATTDASINLMRLRLAYGKLTWTNAELIFGHYWHPLFITDCFPDVISFNTGSPFQPFARNPQLRLSYNVGKLKLIGAVNSQVDYASYGPNGKSTSYIRNSQIPETNIQIHYNSKNESTGGEIVAGIGIGQKRLVPTLATSKNVKTHEFISSMHSIAFAKMKTKYLTLRLEGVYGANMSDFLLLGGFAAKDITTYNYDPNIDNVEYSYLQSESFWADISTNGKNLQFGIFAGYTKKLEANSAIDLAKCYSFLSCDIASISRLSPRVVYTSGKVKVAIEFEITKTEFADYSKPNAITNKGVINETYSVTNYRGLLGIYYNF